MKLPMLPHDKANHFIYGLVIFSLTYSITNYVIASLVCSLFAFGKEVYDNYSDNHTPDIMDALATIGGGCLAFLMIYFL